MGCNCNCHKEETIKTGGFTVPSSTGTTSTSFASSGIFTIVGLTVEQKIELIKTLSSIHLGVFEKSTQVIIEEKLKQILESIVV